MLVSEIRQAGAEDIDFLIEAIIEAEKSGSEMISYCGIFGLSQAELIELMRKMLAEDLEGQQLCISGFAIACVDGEAVATCCSWIEGTYGISSSIITGSLLGEYLPAANFKEGLSKNEIMKGIHIERTKGCLQIESVYTLAAFRGKGLIRKLIQHHALQAQAPAVEIILAQTNENALAAYQKMGFSLKHKVTGDEALLQFLPSNSRLQLTSPLHLLK